MGVLWGSIEGVLRTGLESENPVRAVRRGLAPAHPLTITTILNGIEEGAKVDHTHEEYAANDHVHEEYETKITAIENNLETIQSSTNSVLENHAEALNAVCNATLKNITDISTNHTKINSVESIINEYIAKTDAVLKNHYDAILLLCQKHGMIDSNENDNENITPGQI